MSRPKSFVLLIAIACLAGGGRASQDRSCFTAAVYEHVMDDYLPDYFDTVDANLRVFDRAMAEAKAKGADIIVFPEGTVVPRGNRTLLRLNSDNIPDVTATAHNPCRQPDRYHPRSPLVKLSCMAAKHAIYTVANIVDIKPCPQEGARCSQDGFRIYSANVAFDRNGHLVARYHKVHPFNEFDVDAPTEPEYAYFDTEFGRIGTFICADIIYEDGARFVHEKGIDSLAFPTWWHDDLPIYSGLHIQQSFAVLHDINLLAANVQQPRSGCLGSGIYSGRLHGVVRYTHVPDSRPKLVVARLPKNTKQDVSCSARDDQDVNASADDVWKSPTYVYDHTDFSEYTMLALKSGEHHETACNNGLCCHLDYKMTGPSSDDFYFGVHNGTKVTGGLYTIFEEVCILIACRFHPDVGSKVCSDVALDVTTTFEYVNLGGRFSTDSVFPAVMSKHGSFVAKQHWRFHHVDSRESKYVEIALKGAPDAILGVFLNGRCFDRE